MAGIIAGAQNFGRTPSEQMQWDSEQKLNTDMYNNPSGPQASGLNPSIINGPSIVPSKMHDDWNSFFNTTPAGSSVPFAGGTLTHQDIPNVEKGGGATYTDSNGNMTNLTNNQSMSDLAKYHPEIASAWKTQYGFNPEQTPSGVVPSTVPASSPNVTTTQPTTNTATSPSITPATTTSPGIITSNQSPNMSADYNAYWANNPVGSKINVAGGTMTRTDAGTATFTSADGKSETLTPTSNYSDLAKGNASLAAAWKNNYGFNADGNNLPSTSAASSTNASQLGNPNQWNVNSDQTTSGQLQKLIDPNSAMAQSWMHAGANDAAARGFTGNSTIRDTAMMDSLIRNATPIAQSDAAINAKAAGYNADMPNQFAMTNVGANNQLNLTNVNANNQKLISSMNNESQQIISRAHDANAVLIQNDTGAQQAYNSFIGSVAQINQNDKMDATAKARSVEAQRILFNEAIAARTKANPNLGISQSQIGVLTPEQQKAKDDADHNAVIKNTGSPDVSNQLQNFGGAS